MKIGFGTLLFIVFLILKLCHVMAVGDCAIVDSVWLGAFDPLDWYHRRFFRIDKFFNRLALWKPEGIMYTGALGCAFLTVTQVKMAGSNPANGSHRNKVYKTQLIEKFP